MAPKIRVRDPNLPETPRLTHRDPSLPTMASIRSRSRIIFKDPNDPDRQSAMKKCCFFMWNRNEGTFCGRSCKSWGAIILYSFMYLIFLSSYTMIFLYGSLCIIKTLPVNSRSPQSFELTYSDSIGLTVTPTSEDSYPLIQYRHGEADDYEKYVNAIDKLFSDHRSKRHIINNVGPCSEPPYGYGDKPCIFVTINQNMQWSGKPLESDSPSAKDVPDEVRNWMKSDKKIWLHCTGFHSYDKEHIRNLKYYPDPPGFDYERFPVDLKRRSQLVAVQISNFTLGISLAIECKLWYESGVSSVVFMIYVVP